MYNRHLPLSYRDRYGESFKYNQGNYAPTARQFSVGFVCPVCNVDRGMICTGVKYPHSARVKLARAKMTGNFNG